MHDVELLIVSRDCIILLTYEEHLAFETHCSALPGGEIVDTSMFESVECVHLWDD